MHTCISSHGLKRSWRSCPRRVNAGNKNTPSTHHPRRRNVTTLMVGLTTVTYAKISPKSGERKKQTNKKKTTTNKQTNKNWQICEKRVQKSLISQTLSKHVSNWSRSERSGLEYHTKLDKNRYVTVETQAITSHVESDSLLNIDWMSIL